MLKYICYFAIYRRFGCHSVQFNLLCLAHLEACSAAVQAMCLPDDTQCGGVQEALQEEQHVPAYQFPALEHQVRLPRL